MNCEQCNADLDMPRHVVDHYLKLSIAEDKDEMGFCHLLCLKDWLNKRNDNPGCNMEGYAE